MSFAKTWRHKHYDSAMGVNCLQRGLIYYDCDLIERMPDDVALVLITHEWAHEFYTDEEEARDLNDQWHARYPSFYWLFERGYEENLEDCEDELSGEDLLDMWAEQYITEEHTLAQQRQALREIEDEIRQCYDTVLIRRNEQMLQQCVSKIKELELMLDRLARC